MAGKKKVKKRNTEESVPSELVSHGEQFMALFDGYHDSKRQKVSSAIFIASSPVEEEEKEKENLNSSSDVRSDQEDIVENISDEMGKISEGEISDSLECLNALDNRKNLREKKEKKERIQHIPQVSKREKKKFMSGSIKKVHKAAPLAAMPVDLSVEEDDEEESRKLFKKASREVQHLGSKGMTKRATKNWRQQEWEKLGGKRAKLHRMPKSDGMLMFRGRVRKEEAARDAEARKGAVLRESLQVLKQQQAKKRKFLAKRKGGNLRKTLI